MRPSSTHATGCPFTQPQMANGPVTLASATPPWSPRARSMAARRGSDFAACRSTQPFPSHPGLPLRFPRLRLENEHRASVTAQAGQLRLGELASCLRANQLEPRRSQGDPVRATALALTLNINSPQMGRTSQVAIVAPEHSCTREGVASRRGEGGEPMLLGLLALVMGGLVLGLVVCADTDALPGVPAGWRHTGAGEPASTPCPPAVRASRARKGHDASTNALNV